MQEQKKEIWFPAKKYGLGWGFPVTWQGWLFFVGWLGVFIAGISYARNNISSYLVFWSFVICMVVILFAVCFLKGEKPKWRWGE